VQAGVELVSQVLLATGVAATALPAGGQSPALAAAADGGTLWRGVAARVALEPHQLEQVCEWRQSFLRGMEACYARRAEVKQLVMDPLRATAPPAAGEVAGAGAQFSEQLLLEAASTVGYTLPAVSAAGLDTAVDALRESLAEQRAGACGAMQHLLLHVFTPVQAARYLLAAHPFAWNGLAFAHAAAEPPPAEPPAAAAG
jgi:hypothetical protein